MSKRHTREAIKANESGYQLEEANQEGSLEEGLAACILGVPRSAIFLFCKDTTVSVQKARLLLAESWPLSSASGLENPDNLEPEVRGPRQGLSTRPQGGLA